MGGGTKEAQSVHPAPGGRGDQGLGPSSLAHTCLLYPCLHWERASRRVQELTEGGPYLLPGEEYTVLTPWGLKELGSTPQFC